MKATFFYSEKQREAGYRIDGRYRNNMVNGKLYTELCTLGTVHESNWDDAIVVHEESYLPMDLNWLECHGQACAVTPWHIINTDRRVQRYGVYKDHELGLMVFMAGYRYPSRVGDVWYADIPVNFRHSSYREACIATMDYDDSYRL